MHQVSLTYQKKLENNTTFKTDLLSSLEILDETESILRKIKKIKIDPFVDNSH